MKATDAMFVIVSDVNLDKPQVSGIHEVLCMMEDPDVQCILCDWDIYGVMFFPCVCECVFPAGAVRI